MIYKNTPLYLCLFMLDATHLFLLAAAELVLQRQTGSFLAGSLTCTLWCLPNIWQRRGGGAARSSTSFQVFQCDNNILARAIMSQKSPYSDVITNIFPSSEVNILWHRTLQHGVFLFTSWDESMHHLNFHHNSQHGGWKTCPPVLNKENTKNPTRMSFTSH